MRAISFTEKNITINGNALPISRVVLIRLIDDNGNQKINAIVKYFIQNKTVTLFSGVSYKPLNEYTEQEIDNRIIELIN